jgi:hypothetical protein
MPSGPKGEKRPGDLIDNIAYLIRILALALLGANATLYAASAQSLDEILQREKAKQQNQLALIAKLAKPLGDCVRKRAHTYELYSSPEKADVAARAAVGLCAKEEGAYRSAVFRLATLVTDFDAAATSREMHDQLVEAALTVIVSERQHQHAQPETNDTETQHFKRGCSDYVAGRTNEDALNCVRVLSTALELIVIIQGEGGTKGVNICIPKDPSHPLLVKDYVNLIYQHPDLMDDNAPISVGLLRILAREFPCANR